MVFFVASVLVNDNFLEGYKLSKKFLPLSVSQGLGEKLLKLGSILTI